MSWPAEIPGVVIAGSYHLVRSLDGERGRVYEARHERLAGRLAVKLFEGIDPQAFRRNAQLALALRHQGIAQVIDYGTDDGSARAAVVMEYLEGRPLASVLGESGLLPVDRAVRLVGGVAAG